MVYSLINQEILNVYKNCNIKSFPIDCHNIIELYGYRVVTYSELKKNSTELGMLCTTFSDDAFSDSTNKIIAYNELNPFGRIRFSLMHELGHIVLEHSGGTPSQEREANYFASHSLAPSIAIHYSKCFTNAQIARLFSLTPKAAKYAEMEYQYWIRTAAYRMSFIDRQMYEHFYNKDYKGFVWNIDECERCGNIKYNSYFDNLCSRCRLSKYMHRNLFLEENYVPNYY